VTGAGKLVFVSHISEEGEVAGWLKETLNRDFLEIFEVFVSSDTESINAGSEWLDSVRTALDRARIVCALCSSASVSRPWVNFELGAAWMRGTPIIPVCHSGLTPRELPAPLSIPQGLTLSEPGGIERLYRRLADEFGCRVPEKNFGELAQEAPVAAVAASPPQGLGDDQSISSRLRQALEGPKEWRTVEWAAIEAGVSEEVAAEKFRGDDGVRFSKSKAGKVIVGLKSRVGDHTGRRVDP
jgi:hypothetical protein